MSIDGRMDAAERRTNNSKAFRNFEKKAWIDEPPTTAAERKRYNKDLAAVKNESSKNTAAAVKAGRQQMGDQTKAFARKAALDAARKKAKAKPPVMSEGTGNPSDPRDWTNAPGTADWAEQLRKANGGR